MAGPFRIAPYPYSRFWALYEGDELLGVTVYKKGAVRIAERIKELAPGTEIEIWQPPKQSHLEKEQARRAGRWGMVSNR
jgi:hypothetical protein